MTETSKYKLTQWAKSDRIEMEDFNDDNAKLEAALRSHDTAIAARATTAALDAETAARTKAVSDETAARRSAVTAEENARKQADTALQTAVNKEVSDRKAAISGEAAARTSAVSTLNAAMGKLGNCQLYYTTYTGTGAISANNLRSFTFPHPPRLVVVAGRGEFFYALPVTTNFKVGNYEEYVCTWSGNTFSFYGTNSHMDYKDLPYAVVALLDAGK